MIWPLRNQYHLRGLQSHNQKLVPFASLLAISGTFNSLSKVLFIFPSQYLFAIGLRPIFSFRGQLPPVLHSMSKERDSKNPHRMRNFTTWTGFSPSMTFFSKKTYAASYTGDRSQDYNSRLGPDLQVELFPVQSPLLRESYSFSFPPLTYMLKFSG